MGWKGGYPDGLSAGQIPLAARVVAVADAFLAMRQRRPYRLPLTKRAALKELRRNAGSQFDPSCVEALVSIIKSVRFFLSATESCLVVEMTQRHLDLADR